MADVKFYIEKRKDSARNLIVANVPILLFYSFGGKRLQYFTGERIDAKYYTPEYWKMSKEPIKKTAPSAEKINRNLRSLKLHLENIHSDAKALGTIPDVEFFRAKLNELLKGEASKKEITLQDAFVTYLEKTKASKAYNTFTNTQTMVNHFNKSLGNKKLKFSQLDSKVVDIFRSYLIGKGHLNNTVVKNLRVFRRFVNWCKEESQNYIDNFSVAVPEHENEIDVIFLNHDEVLTLYKLQLDKPALERVRDCFVFGCFTAARFGDIAKLKKSDVEDSLIRFRIEKAGRTVSHTVPLAPIAKAILNKYRDLPGERALPVISNQKANDALKIICKKAGFDAVVTVAEKAGNGRISEIQYKKFELITCHTSRKSFITIAMMLGMTESTIKSITGHSKNSRAFYRYYDIVDSHKQSEMNRIFGNG